MFGRDARSSVFDRELGPAIGQPSPCHLDAATARRVAHGIDQQVGHRALKFGGRTRNFAALEAGTDLHTEPMAQRRQAVRQAPGLLLHMLEQRPYGRPLMARRRRTAFEPRQHQQVAHQRFHALRLLRHQSQIARCFIGRQRQRLQCFDKAGQHRERRANLMRRVGDKVAPHRLGLLQRCDIARQQHAAVAGIRMHLHRQAQRQTRPLAAGGRRVDQHIAAVVQRGEVSDKGRVTHQIGQML